LDFARLLFAGKDTPYVSRLRKSDRLLVKRDKDEKSIKVRERSVDTSNVAALIIAFRENLQMMR
jgi:hypothetical protein